MEQHLGLFADRTSTETLRANQIRLWFSSVASVLLHALRRCGENQSAAARFLGISRQTLIYRIQEFGQHRA